VHVSETRPGDTKPGTQILRSQDYGRPTTGRMREPLRLEPGKIRFRGSEASAPDPCSSCIRLSVTAGYLEQSLVRVVVLDYSGGRNLHHYQAILSCSIMSPPFAPFARGQDIKTFSGIPFSYRSASLLVRRDTSPQVSVVLRWSRQFHAVGSLGALESCRMLLARPNPQD
jgi:hypothetical protein